MKDRLPETLNTPGGLPSQSDPTLPAIGRLLADQEARWQNGERVLVETFIEQQSSLRDDARAVMGLIANESVLRRKRCDAAPAEAAARLQHPNITQIYEVGESQGRPYFAMEYVEGCSLADKLDGTPQPPHVAAELVEILARAMHHAHERGIVHRDLKPANILLLNSTSEPGLTTSLGQPKISDFGLAKRLDADLRQTQTGAVLGTP